MNCFMSGSFSRRYGLGKAAQNTCPGGTLPGRAQFHSKSMTKVESPTIWEIRGKDDDRESTNQWLEQRMFLRPVIPFARRTVFRNRPLFPLSVWKKPRRLLPKNCAFGD